jgi:glycosyltransferase involved in cell wall biosynthesis
MPHYADRTRAGEYLDEAIAGIRAQTNGRWRLVIVDDASPEPSARARLLALARAFPDHIEVIFSDVNQGPGICRNIGSDRARQRGSEIVLFHDADDISHPRRLAVSQSILEANEADFVYSTFIPIDESGQEVPFDSLTPSIQEILESHATPVQGADAWISIATETGYTSLTSTIAVRTELAVAHPFPAASGAEDMHTWLRMSAGGGVFAFRPDIPTRYRVSRDGAGSANRGRVGADYYRTVVSITIDGFRQALDLALERGSLTPDQVPGLTASFFRRLARTVSREGRADLAGELTSRTEF